MRVVLGSNVVLGLNQPARIVLGRNVTQPYVARNHAEQRNSVSNEHRHPRDNEALNKAFAQEPLNRYPSVDIQVMDTTGSELRNDLSWRPGHLLYNASAHRR